MWSYESVLTLILSIGIPSSFILVTFLYCCAKDDSFGELGFLLIASLFVTFGMIFLTASIMYFSVYKEEFHLKMNSEQFCELVSAEDENDFHHINVIEIFEQTDNFIDARIEFGYTRPNKDGAKDFIKEFVSETSPKIEDGEIERCLFELEN